MNDETAMMVETHDDFVERLELLGRKHAKMTNGYSTKIDQNGNLVAVPKRKSALPGVGLAKFALLLLIGLLGFKSFAVAVYGPVTYNERLATLEGGTVVEQVGAKALAIDPVTAAIAEAVAPALH